MRAPVDLKPADRPKHKLVLVNVPPPPTGWRRWAQLAGLVGLIGLTGVTMVMLGLYYKYSEGLPDIPKVEQYWPPILSEIHTQDGVLAGEFYNERRKVVPYDHIPKRLVQAFIASEDSSFFDHMGVDVLGTARAAFKTILKKASGSGSVQGGSTLTQQTAKALLVSAELKSRIDNTEIVEEAERRVPPAQPPSAAEIAAEVKEITKNRTKMTPEEKASVEASAKERLTKRAELARSEAVKAEITKVREAKVKSAFAKGTEKKLSRKVREAILAWRLEGGLTKEEILYIYLNNVYLGQHSYGVQAAAENYFRKDVRDLTLAEMSLIAGLPQAPSRYSPFGHPDAAAERRSYVLGRMLKENMISKEEWEAARKTQIRPVLGAAAPADAKEGDVLVYKLEDVFHEFAPYFTEEVRRYVKDRYGSATLLNDGLRVYTTMDSEKQRAAQKSVLDNLLAVDKRQGFRGPVMQLKTAAERKAFLEKMKKAMFDEKIQENRFYAALVTGIDPEGMYVDVQVGPHKGVIPLLGMRWARKLNPEGYYPAVLLDSVRRVLFEGDVVVVRAVARKNLNEDKEQYTVKADKAVPEGVQLFRLEQEPELQGALVSIDPHRQYLVAMVGGYDFDANEFNRAFQACRQPGSSYKPLVYSAALEQLGWTQAKMLVDSPVVMDTESTEVRWKPQNFAGTFQGDVVLRHALVNSMNIPAVKTFGSVGVKKMAAWAKQLGLSTPMNEDFSAALGSSCVYPYELAQVYATFDRLGNKRPTYFVRKVEDRFGRTLEDHTSFDDSWASLNDRIAGGYARLFEPGEQVYSPENGFVLVDLLRGVVKEGTGAPAQKLGKPAAGKTGTTNDSFDTWFAGFTRDLVAVSWMGYDKNVHPLGGYETGGRASLPMWLAYMREALAGKPQGEFTPPAGLEVVQLPIDLKTGKIASSGSKSVMPMWFKKGTEPEDKAPEKGHIDPHDVDIMNVQ